MRERFHSTDADAGPPPLSDVSKHQPDAVSLTDLLAQGGPSLESLRRELDAASSGHQPVASLGALFEQRGPALRRPVEIFGLLHLATNLPHLDRHDDTETYRAIRVDGSTRDLTVPRAAPRSADEENR